MVLQCKRVYSLSIKMESPPPSKKAENTGCYDKYYVELQQKT